MKNSAVEFIIQRLAENGILHSSDVCEAKEMEDAQRKKDFIAGNDSACMEHENIEDYFNQYIKAK